MHRLHWTIGDFKLNVYNGPGLIMAALWVIHTVLVIFFYPIVDKLRTNGDSRKSSKDCSEKDKLLGQAPKNAASTVPVNQGPT